MFEHYQDSIQLNWIRGQLHELEAWREEVARRPVLDISEIVKLENHYAWLSGELERLERHETRRVV